MTWQKKQKSNRIIITVLIISLALGQKNERK